MHCCLRANRATAQQVARRIDRTMFSLQQMEMNGRNLCTCVGVRYCGHLAPAAEARRGAGYSRHVETLVVERREVRWCPPARPHVETLVVERREVSR